MVLSVIGLFDLLLAGALAACGWVQRLMDLPPAVSLGFGSWILLFVLQGVVLLAARLGFISGMPNQRRSGLLAALLIGVVLRGAAFVYLFSAPIDSVRIATTHSRIWQVRERVLEFHSVHGRAPENLEELGFDPSVKSDAWGFVLGYRQSPDRVVVFSRGAPTRLRADAVVREKLEKTLELRNLAGTERSIGEDVPR